MPPDSDDLHTWSTVYFPQVIEALLQEFNIDEALVSDAFGGFKVIKKEKEWIN